MAVDLAYIYDKGAPAHAGIVLQTGKPWPLSSWCPRTRGDSPDGTTYVIPNNEVPPHTRG